MFFIYTKDFFNHLRSELHSERTIETYCQSLNAFRIYLYETYSKTVDQITIDFVTEEVIREFLSSRQQQCWHTECPAVRDKGIPEIYRYA